MYFNTFSVFFINALGREFFIAYEVLFLFRVILDFFLRKYYNIITI